MLALTTIGVLGTGFCYKTIVFTCNKTINLISEIGNNQYETLNLLLLKSDIGKKIVRTRQLILDINVDKDSIQFAIHDLDEIIETINVLLQHFLDCKTKHEQLYFNTWRTMDISMYIEKLTLYIEIYNHRFRDLVDIMSIIKN